MIKEYFELFIYIIFIIELYIFLNLVGVVSATVAHDISQSFALPPRLPENDLLQLCRARSWDREGEGKWTEKERETSLSGTHSTGSFQGDSMPLFSRSPSRGIWHIPTWACEPFVSTSFALLLVIIIFYPFWIIHVNANFVIAATSLPSISIDNVVLIDVLKYMRGVHQDADGAGGGDGEENVEL